LALLVPSILLVPLTLRTLIAITLSSLSFALSLLARGLPSGLIAVAALRPSFILIPVFTLGALLLLAALLPLTLLVSLTLLHLAWPVLRALPLRGRRLAVLPGTGR
jgi:hypothetical protein